MAAFFERQVLGALEKMPLGRLELIMHGGQSKVFGGGTGISAVLEIKDRTFFRKCVLYGDIGFGESYVEGSCESPDITRVLEWFLLNHEYAPGVSGSGVKEAGLNLLRLWNKVRHWTRVNSIAGSKKNIEEHYDLGNDFFRIFLDPSMTYSCAYFENGEGSLEQAQYAKMDMLHKLMILKPGMKVLEIGCGWGANAIRMAKRHDVQVMGITISEEQFRLASERVKEEGMEGMVEIMLCDYRDVKGSFDRIISIEMLEAVGDEYFETFFGKCQEVLSKNGLMALQVITCPDARYDELKNGVDFIQKHIFPGSLLPSVARLNRAINSTGNLTLTHLEDMGQHYARTLNTWKKNFNAGADQVRLLGFDERFIRKWNYYFSYCEAAFAMRNIYVMQMLYSRPNVSE